jgi:hypothetical protein
MYKYTRCHIASSNVAEILRFRQNRLLQFYSFWLFFNYYFNNLIFLLMWRKCASSQLLFLLFFSYIFCFYINHTNFRFCIEPNFRLNDSYLVDSIFLGLLYFSFNNFRRSKCQFLDKLLFTTLHLKLIIQLSFFVS